jgi:hypothetical protein
MSAMISKNIFGLSFLDGQLNCIQGVPLISPFCWQGAIFFFLGGRFFQLVVRKKNREMR